jgi:hypothetical protein
MKKNFTFLVIFLFVSLFSCFSSTPPGWKDLDVKLFKILVPQNWKFNDPGNQEDSFVGHITGPKVILSFDYSDQGYANHLLQTEQEFIKEKSWMYIPSYFEGTKANTGNFIVKKITKPTNKQKTEFPGSDYIAQISYNGKVFYEDITIPHEIKGHFIKIDTVGKYIFKTIWPKTPGMGVTGIYIHSRSSSFNFQMSGRNLSVQNQQVALKAFKTITFKE